MPPFDVIINCDFLALCGSPPAAMAERKRVLSFINDFEDGAWRFSKFQEYIWDNIAQTALSARERNVLVNKPHGTLVEAAKKLRFSDKGDETKGSELAEVLLYAIMREHFGALPVVPKIFYKQNANDFAKGADSVHIVLGEGTFTIWFGEAKFYNSIEDARLGAIITSIEELLSTEKLKKENSIVTGLSDLDELVSDKDTLAKIKELLDNRSSIDGLKPFLHIPILLLHECSLTAAATGMSEQYKQALMAYHRERAISFFNKQIERLGEKVHLYADITFHLILFPVPCKKTIVEEFVANASHYRGRP